MFFKLVHSCFATLLAMLAAATADAQPTAGEIQAGLPPSLQFAPDSVSFFYALTNNRLKWDALADNAAIERLMAMPVVQRAVAQARTQIAADIEQDLQENEVPSWLRSAYEFWVGKEGQSYLPTMANLASRELFIFADQDFAEQLAAYNAEVVTQLSKLRLDPSPDGEGVATENDAPEPVWSERFIRDLNVPRIVAGAKLSGSQDQARVSEMLSMFATKFRNELLDLSEAENRYISDSLQLQDLGENDQRWVLHLRGDEYPWDAAIQRHQAASDPDEAAEIQRQYTVFRDLVAGKSLVVSVGFTDGYLFASIGHDPDDVAPTKADQPLYRRGVFKPLLENRSKTFSAIAYQNSLLKQQTSWVTRLSVYLRLLPGLAKLAFVGTELEPTSYQPLMDDVEQDAEMLLADLNRLYNPAGDQLAFSFFFNGGIAGYNYHRHTNPMSVSAQPLVSLQHVGEHPALFSAVADWEDDGTLDKWLNRIEQRAEQVMDLYVESSGASASGPAQAMTTGLAELFRATKDDLLPSLGNESAFVLDFQHRSHQWHPAMPAAEQALPMPAVALVYDLANAEQHRRAWQRFYETINPLLAPFGPLMGLPPGQGLPPASETSIPDGVFLRLPGVAVLGIDPSFAPGLAITDQWAIYTLFPSQGVDLAEPHAPQLPPPLGDVGRPLIAASHVDVLQFADALQAWLDYAVPLIKQSDRYQNQTPEDAEASKAPNIDETIDLLGNVIEVMRQIPSYTQATYVQDNSVVTQSVIQVPSLRLSPAK